MGGGDLNSKKSWHPNTIKNQEKVWKAEQAQAQEKKRISELQRERAEEKDRAELNDMAKRNFGTPNDDRLHWMYDKPDKKVQHEEFLLGKSLDKHNESNKQEQNMIPVVSQRVVGSSMLTSASDTQVDLARKLREDPLLLVKERERAARAALLNNPIHRRKITELLRKEQEQKQETKSKKSRNKSKDLDNMLAAKLNALGGDKGLCVAALLASDDSNSESSADEKQKSKKKKKKRKSEKKSKKKKLYDSDVSSSHDEKRMKGIKSSRYKNASPDRANAKSERKRKNDMKSDDSQDRHKSRREQIDKESKVGDSRSHLETTPSNISSYHKHHRSNERILKGDRPDDRRHEERFRNRSRSQEHKSRENRKKISSVEEKEARLAEMAAAGAARELERGRRVLQQREEDAEAARPAPRTAPRHALPDSLEARIHSTRHYIQRDRKHMDTNFAKR